MVHVNKELISLKCVLFLFFAGLGCLFPFLPLHMLSVGLNVNEAQIISIVAPCISLLGPILFGPLADKLAESSTSEKGNKHGKCLRFMIALVMILGAIFYGSLLLVPSTLRLKGRNPQVSFACDTNGGFIVQERCVESQKCYEWDSDKIGSVHLRKCRYACHSFPIGKISNASSDKSTIFSHDSEYDYNEDDGGLGSNSLMADSYETYEIRNKRQDGGMGIIEPPHICYKDSHGGVICKVYSEYTNEIEINVRLTKALNTSEADGVCRYPIADFFRCQINAELKNKVSDSSNCQPVISCDIENAYDPTGSLLAESRCMKIVGDPDVTFWLYLILRSIADIFPTAAITLLDAAIVIATRETSSGRGDVGKQLAWGAFGFAILAPIIGLLNDTVMPEYPEFGVGFYGFIVFMVLAAVVILLSSEMPLSPPEWWWYTKCGMLALPMSTVRKYGMETGALIVVLITLGVFWSALDSYLPWHLKGLSSSPFLIGFTIFVGAFPSIPFLWYAEKTIDFCGHSNLLIVAFITYIVRFAGLSVIRDPWMVLILESLEVFSLFLMWITAVLYLRHLVPRKFTATGQALAVIAHFCIGRSIGALIGAVIDSDDIIYSIQCLYKWLSVAAAVVATIYFLVYYLYLKPYYHTPIITSEARQPITILQGSNGNRGNGTSLGNGAYTPLRVYHNSKARKAFRYQRKT